MPLAAAMPAAAIVVCYAADCCQALLRATPFFAAADAYYADMAA